MPCVPAPLWLAIAMLLHPPPWDVAPSSVWSLEASCASLGNSLKSGCTETSLGGVIPEQRGSGKETLAGETEMPHWVVQSFPEKCASFLGHLELLSNITVHLGERGREPVYMPASCLKPLVFQILNHRVWPPHFFSWLYHFWGSLGEC